MGNWKRLFSERVLGRGIEYWREGSVLIVSREDGLTEAEVIGTDLYNVEIKLDEMGSVTEMDCDCPHANDGNNCKHMAAVLFELDELDSAGKGNQPAAPRSRVPSIQEAIESMDVDQLRSELLKAASADAVLKAQLIARYASYNDADGKPAANNDWTGYIVAMKSRIRNLIYTHSDRGFVDWRQGGPLMMAFETEVFGELMDIVDFGEEAEVAFQLSMYLLEEFSSVDMDGSGGEHGEFEDSMMELWEEVYKKSSEEQRTSMFEHLLAYYEGAEEREEFFSDMTWSFMQGRFDDRTLSERKLALVDEKLAGFEELIKAEATQKASGKRKRPATMHMARYSEYALARLVLDRLALMESLGASRDEMLAFRERFRFLSQVRALEMKDLENAGRYEELIELLEESRALDANKAGLVTQYSDQLIGCYEKLGRQDDALKEARAYVVHRNPQSLEGFARLKSLYPKKDWVTERDKAFAELTTRGVNINALYEAENLPDRIMKAISQKASEKLWHPPSLLQEISRYSPTLRPTYDKELLDAYRRISIMMAAPASGRAGYRELVGVLRRMLDYPGGEDCVRALIEEWQETYRNRPAMQEELGKVFKQKPLR